jgi:hypothetical protein
MSVCVGHSQHLGGHPVPSLAPAFCSRLGQWWCGRLEVADLDAGHWRRCVALMVGEGAAQLADSEEVGIFSWGWTGGGGANWRTIGWGILGVSQA